MITIIIDHILWPGRKYKQGNGVTRSQPIPLSNEGWNYIKICFLRRGVPTVNRDAKRAYKVYFNYLTSTILTIDTTKRSSKIILRHPNNDRSAMFCCKRKIKRWASRCRNKRLNHFKTKFKTGFEFVFSCCEFTKFIL